MATDGGRPPLSTTVLVLIDVAADETRPPSFVPPADGQDYNNQTYHVCLRSTSPGVGTRKRCLVVVLLTCGETNDFIQICRLKGRALFSQLHTQHIQNTRKTERISRH